MHRLLDGIRLLDLTRLLPGPYATLLLADLGAEVIKIEEPNEGDPVRALPPLHSDGTSYLFHLLHRNKASLALNLKTSVGREIFLKLAQSADAIIEGFRPGVTARLGIDYATTHAVKSDIIYCSLTGYGQSGPYRDYVGHDLNYISIAGLLGLTGQREPVIPGVPVADLVGGTLAAFYILAALLKRARTSDGEYIDLSLTDSVHSLMTLHFAHYFGAQQSSQRGQLPLGGHYACYSVYKTRDGRFLSLACLEPKFWQSFCESVQRRDWMARQFDPSLNADAQKLMESRPLAEWLNLLDPLQIPVTPVYEELSAVHQDPHLRRRRLFVEGLEQIAPPVTLAQALAAPDRLAPRLGQQTDEILSKLSFSQSAIARWRAEGIVG
ncbi:CoA transferase [Candidatus Acetothermia bacterium]|jgi:crotonobetainyl-CoA:carnitine CoA-transferase CaiB-like acyl-CoA transferase|nr:CoA transferase [Candidatus Acetothermia bacterium]MCI2431700.1 CoA transferase [Candidatus Acetothermia bacterium]MCI2435675.1 CoA transferase [Candidatus Acetothermia bacterium]